MPHEPNLHWILSEIKLQEHDLQGARDTLKVLAEMKYPQALLDLMQARVYFHEGKWLQASQQFRAIAGRVRH